MARKRKARTANKRTQKELRAHGKRLDALIARAKQTERRAAKAYARQRQVLRAKQAQAQKALQRLRRQSAAAAPVLKTGLRRAWSDLNTAMKQAAARFRSSS